MIRVSGFFSVICSILLGCTEIIPPIHYIDPGGGPGDQQARRVLIEEFTGVQCVQCPEGAEEIANLIGIHGDRLVAVGIHAGHFAIPFPQSQHDFRSQDALQLYQLLGPVGFYPSAVINRRTFAGENSRVLNKDKWAGYIAQELQKPAFAAIHIEPTWSISSREITAEIGIEFYQPLNDELYLTVLIMESNIVDAQLTPQTTIQNPDQDYVHKHVMRRAMTSAIGNIIGSEFTTGQVINRTFTQSIPVQWNESEISIVAFISKPMPQMEVFQVNEKRLIP